MTGRLHSTPQNVMLVDAVALSVAMLLGYSAAANSGGHSLLDFGGFPVASGMKLLFAFVICLAAGMYTLVSLSRRLRI